MVLAYEVIYRVSSFQYCYDIDSSKYYRRWNVIFTNSRQLVQIDGFRNK